MSKIHRVFKTTLGTGKTFYSVSEQATSEEAFKNTTLSIAVNNVSKNRASTEYQKQLFDSRDSFSVKLISEHASKTEAKASKDMLISKDINNINSVNIYKGRVNAKSSELRIHKCNSLTLNGETYVSASRVDNYPSLKGKFSTSESISHPTKGRFFKITSSNVTRF